MSDQSKESLKLLQLAAYARKTIVPRLEKMADYYQHEGDLEKSRELQVTIDRFNKLVAVNRASKKKDNHL